MKKKSTSRCAPAPRSLGEGGFFNLRVLIGFVFCLAGVFIALAGASLYLGSSKAQAQPGSGSAATARAQTGTQAPLFHPHQVTPWTPRTEPFPPLQAPLLPTIQLSTTAWTALGPAPLNSADPNGNVSGRIAAIAAHSTDANTIYVAPAGGGVWKPTNANIAYAAMANFGVNGVFTNGITGTYKTTDAGSTWTNVTMANGNDSAFPWSDVVVDPNTPSTVYAAVGYLFGTANNGVYKS